jgi:hypothetical protein
MPFTFSGEALECISAAKRGTNNPFYGAWGWRHSTCTNESKVAWKRADEILIVHQQHPTWGPSRVSAALNLDKPYRSAAVLAKLKEGWRPGTDPEWVSWATTWHN